MQTHVVQLTKQRLSDFFVKEEGHVAHKNALVAGTVATGAIFASMLLAPDTAEADDHKFLCGDKECDTFKDACCSDFHEGDGAVFYFCPPIKDGCPA